jgi:hypothetical protein
LLSFSRRLSLTVITVFVKTSSIIWENL